MRWAIAAVLFACGARSEIEGSTLFDASTFEAGSADVAISDAGDEKAQTLPPLACAIAPFDDLPYQACPPTCMSFDEATAGAFTLSGVGCTPALHQGDNVTVAFPCFRPPYYGYPDTFDAGGQLAFVELGPPFKDQALRFYGALTSDQIMTGCMTTTFVGDDGCTWSTRQTITGPVRHVCSPGVDGPPGADGPFTFTYEEQPIQGAACNAACTATATLTTQ